MDRMLRDADAIARACKTLGVNPTKYDDVEKLMQAVIARGREQLGCAGLADMLAARLSQLEPEYARTMHARWRRHDAN